MESNQFEGFLIKELQILLDAENQIVEALPKFAGEASTNELKEALKDHIQETKKQVARLEKALKILGADIKGEPSKAMQGLLSEGEDVIRGFERSLLKDAAIIGSCQKVEHYEIAAYGTARAHARLLDIDEVVDLLKETIEEEAAADRKLTKIAEGSIFSKGINKRALAI